MPIVSHKTSSIGRASRSGFASGLSHRLRGCCQFKPIAELCAAFLLGLPLKRVWYPSPSHCDGDELKVTVANHGAVMSAEELNQLFSLTPLANQLSHRIQTDDPTLRLGLNLAMAIARALDGSCEVAPDSRLGSVWSIVVPALPVFRYFHRFSLRRTPQQTKQ